jgi:AcrR family transcriptional regulator
VGRARSIDRQAVLDAAERVVARDGAAHLTLEAVAIEAGISKASVIYDYKSKHALIKAVIERAVAHHADRLRAHVEAQGEAADRAMKGRLAAAAERSFTDAERTVSLNLVAALACNRDLRGLIESSYREQIAEIAATSPHPRRAMLAFLALEGLSLLEWLGFIAWPQNERDALLADIGAVLAGAGPGIGAS